MLLFKRRVGEKFFIYPDQSIDGDMTIEALFNDGPIEVTIFETFHGQTQIGVEAPKSLTIRRCDY